MRLLLPPSETKRTGGNPHHGQYALAFPEQDAVRQKLLAALERFCTNKPVAAVKALGLGPKSVSEIERNRFTDAPVLPAIDRYTGVLFSATESEHWNDSQRGWAAEHIYIHSALFGIISAGDLIPGYRLSYNTKIAGVPLAKYWGQLGSKAIESCATGDWLLDARSIGYRELAPVPVGVNAARLEVFSLDGGKALNHFNKVHKGELVAKLVRDMPKISSANEFVLWAKRMGIEAKSENTESVNIFV